MPLSLGGIDALLDALAELDHEIGSLPRVLRRDALVCLGWYLAQAGNSRLRGGRRTHTHIAGNPLGGNAAAEWGAFAAIERKPRSAGHCHGLAVADRLVGLDGIATVRTKSQ